MLYIILAFVRNILVSGSNKYLDKILKVIIIDVILYIYVFS